MIAYKPSKLANGNADVDETKTDTISFQKVEFLIIILLDWYMFILLSLHYMLVYNTFGLHKNK